MTLVMMMITMVTDMEIVMIMMFMGYTREESNYFIHDNDY